MKLVKKNMRGAFAAGAIALTAMLTFSGCASDPKPTTDVLDIWVDKLEAVADNIQVKAALVSAISIAAKFA